MEEGSSSKNQEMQENVTPPFPPSLSDDDQNSINLEDIIRFDQLEDEVVAPLGNAEESNNNTSNEIQYYSYTIPNNSEPKIPIPPAEIPQSEQHMYMPTSNVVRIMRRAIPPHAKVSEDAKDFMKQCVCEFISFITNEANMYCNQQLRKTVTVEDIIGAMSRLGFDNYVEPLTLYLQKYRESQVHPDFSRRLIMNMMSHQSNNNAFSRTSAAANFGVDQPPQFTTMFDGIGTSLRLGSGGGPSGNGGAGPSTARDGGDLYDPYGKPANIK